MNGRILLVRDGLDGAVAWVAQVLRNDGMRVDVVAGDELAARRSADAVLLRFNGSDPAEVCWTLRRQGYGTIVALSPAASSPECIRLLNAGADSYLDAWLPAAELAARVRVALRFTRWFAAHDATGGVSAAASSRRGGDPSDRAAATQAASEGGGAPHQGLPMDPDGVAATRRWFES